MALLPQLVLDAPKRSNFDLSFINRFTATPGVVIPCMVHRSLPGDHYEISLTHLVKTFALKAPLMGRMNLKFDFFFVPDRLYIPEYRQNNVDINGFADNADVVLPYFNLPLNGKQNNNQVDSPVASSSLLDYLGFPVGFRDLHSPMNVEESSSHRGSESMRFNALPVLGYLDIWRNYYRNPQEVYGFQYGYYGTTTPSQLSYVECTQLDDFFTSLSNGEFRNISYNPSDSASIPEQQISHYEFLDNIFGANSVKEKLSGLMLRCYQPDYLTNFIATNAYNRMQQYNASGSVVVVKNSDNSTFTINQFRLANKLQKLSERAIIAGNRYGEFIRSMFGVRTDDKLDIPEYLGSYSASMDFQDIVNTARPESQTANSTNAFNALGASAGRGINADRSGKFYINTTEYGNIFCMFSIVPMPDYFQGMKKELTKIYLSDEFNPQLDRLGWQPINMSEYFALPTYAGETEPVDWSSDPNWDPFKQVSGYQPAWLEYMTRINELHGEFATTLNYWTIGRTFDRSPDVEPGVHRPEQGKQIPSAYIFPTDYNVSFVDSSVSAQNFMVQVAFDIFAKRPISKKLMPNLG